MVEFAGGPLAGLPDEVAPAPVITASRGETSYVFAERIPGTERWRCQFDLFSQLVDDFAMSPLLALFH